VAAPRSQPVSAAAVQRGWQMVSLPATGSYFEMYVPGTLDLSKPVPLVIFLHGAGGTPEDYESYLFPAADLVGCVVAAPRAASDQGWGTGNDQETVAATGAAVAAMLQIDPDRTSIAGHSAGGAYAYLLAYGTVSHYSAVFSLSAPFYAVTAVADPAYRAPIHMYYGTTDPNYAGGAYAMLEQQWTALGIPWEIDVETGFSHDVWPVSSMLAGFQFLMSKTYGVSCTPDATHLCLQQGRYRVAVTWNDGTGSGVGTVATGAVSSDSGVFWFFDPTNWEMMVKVLDGCTINQRIWVFAAALSTVQYTLTVTDTVSGQTATYQHANGQPAVVTTDTGALATCP
jgi:predicted esterase